MNRTDFQQLADLRIEEACALLALPVPMPDGAYYLAGYAVECALKACISAKFGEHEWPDKKFVQDCHTHDFLTLIRLADLETDRAAKALASAAFKLNWDVVKDWSEQCRYKRYTPAEAKELIDAIMDSTDGILSWIKAHW